MESISNNIKLIKERIKTAALHSGRTPEDIRLMAVTKTVGIEAVEAAYNAGLRLFGENRVYEANEKYSSFYKDAEVHLIGHLQRNKVKTAAAFFSCIQSIDKTQTAAALNTRCELLNKKIDILLEVNTSQEESKSGYLNENALFTSIDEITRLHNLNIRGLMTIAPFTSDRDAVRKSFSSLREMYDEVNIRYPELDIHTLSMGMSSDFDIAIEEGSTLVRLGTSIFGQRNIL